MSTINTILIKRRLPDSPLNSLPVLSGGELGFNEKNYTLYYGASGLGTIAIGGDGAFVNRTTSQTIEGDKTFTGLTTLSSVTVSSNSTLDFNGNVLTDIGTPVNDYDAVTKLYVDDINDSIALNFVDRSTNQTISGEKYFENQLTVDNNLIVTGYVDATSYVDANSYQIDGTEVIDSSRNATFVDVTASGNITVTGDLTVNGNTTTLNTSVTTTSAFDITNSGTGPALEVTQTGEQAVAAFYDDANIALYIDGKTGSAGYVGIGTSTPNEKLTVFGNVSASGNVFGVNGDFTGTLDVDSSVTFGSNLTITGNITGTAETSTLTNFIIDGGSF
jgi:cytoskeletal protein CcmA (bactofilin family)